MEGVNFCGVLFCGGFFLRELIFADRGQSAKSAKIFMLHGIYISYLSIRIPEIAFGKRHDPGHITYLTH